MALKISASTLLTKHYLIVRSDGVKYYESAFIGGTHRFRFGEISCILMSADYRLSFQAGKEVFSIQTDPNNTKHQTVIATLVQEVKRAGAGWAADTAS